LPGQSLTGWVLASRPPADPVPGIGETPPPGLKGGTKLDVTGRTATVPLACAGPANCTGTVALNSRGSKPKGQGSNDRAARARTLGSAAYSIQAGQLVDVRVRLSRRAAKRVRGEGKIAARLVIDTSSGTRSRHRVRLRAGHGSAVG